MRITNHFQNTMRPIISIFLLAITAIFVSCSDFVSSEKSDTPLSLSETAYLKIAASTARSGNERTIFPTPSFIPSVRDLDSISVDGYTTDNTFNKTWETDEDSTAY